MGADAAASGKAADSTVAPHLLRLYYDRLFPTAHMFNWLAGPDTRRMANREWSFTLADDIYVRYCSFATRDDLRAALLSKVPYKIDIGAIYNVPVSMHQTVQAFTPLEKELVFDVDMTDYDDVRTCCSKANICHKCWPLMTAAVTLMTHILRCDFGFQHLLWVYSGRRGVHCWVSDARARRLTNEQRTAVVDYCGLYLGKEGGRTMQLPYPLHPSLERAFEQLLPFFESCMIQQQSLLDNQEKCRQILEYFDSAVREEFLFSSMSLSSLEKWRELHAKVIRHKANPNFMKRPGAYSVRNVLERIVFAHVYPRLDVNVSKQLNHLLKSPFCVHPKTGRVCVPIDPDRVEHFDPFSVPTLAQLDAELNAGVQNQDDTLKMDDEDDLRDSAKEERKYNSDEEDDENKKAESIPAKVKTQEPEKTLTWHDTSLEPHLSYFKKFVSAQQFSNRKEAQQLKVNQNTHRDRMATGGVEEIAIDEW